MTSQIILNIILTVSLNIAMNATLRLKIKRYAAGVASAILSKLAFRIQALVSFLEIVDEKINDIRIDISILNYRAAGLSRQTRKNILSKLRAVRDSIFGLIEKALHVAMASLAIATLATLSVSAIYFAVSGAIFLTVFCALPIFTTAALSYDLFIEC